MAAPSANGSLDSLQTFILVHLQGDFTHEFSCFLQGFVPVIKSRNPIQPEASLRDMCSRCQPELGSYLCALMTLHDCFQVAELALQICSFLESDDLLRLALTCRQLSQFALRTLWHQIKIPDRDTSINPLQCLLPQAGETAPTLEVWFTEPCSQYLAFVQQALVTRQDIHDTLINSITNAFSSDDTHDTTMNTKRTPKFLFPNITLLQYTTTPKASLGFINTLLAPSLTRLYLYFPLETTDNDTISALDQLGSTCPFIIEFDCTLVPLHADLDTEGGFDPMDAVDNPYANNIFQVLSRAVRRWPKLQSLSVPSLTIEALSHISKLDSLYSLSIHRKYILLQSPISDKPTFDEGFEAMDHLELYEWPFASVLEFVSSLQTSCLAIVQIELVPLDFPNAVQWDEFIARLVQCSSSATELVHLQVLQPQFKLPSGQKLKPFFSDQSIVNGNIFRSLFSSQQSLGLLDLGDVTYIRLDDEFVLDLARASPNLTVLNVGTSYPSPFEPVLTLAAFAHVLNHCPKIELLGLVMDTSRIPSSPSDNGVDSGEGENDNNHGNLAKQGRLHDGNFCFHVGHSRINEEGQDRIAGFLALFFVEPFNLLQVAEDIDEEAENMWDAVYELTSYIIMEREEPDA